MQTFTRDQVATHNKSDDCWIIIDRQVFNVTSFSKLHPGGTKIITNLAGSDVSKEFWSAHSTTTFSKYNQKLQIGVLDDYTPKTKSTSSTLFGDLIPYGDSAWYQGLHSPYYNDSHKKFRNAMREWTEREVTPFAAEWDEQRNVPREILRKAYDAGWLPGCSGPRWPSTFVGDKIAGGVLPSEWNAFHELILYDELGRCGVAGVCSYLTLGIAVGIPPILAFGSDFLKTKVVKSVLTGEKAICLAITEPSAGSDVQGIKTEARLTLDGKYYIVNGQKKFITNGLYSDYFTMAVRTGGSGASGISFLLLEKGMEGLKVKPMTMQGVWSSGTSYITLEDVKVPVENLIGKENDGFKMIMHNFNHERWMIVCGAVRGARMCYEESFKYAYKRKTFGKRLIDSQVIRSKLGNMIRQIESVSTWLEFLTYQLTKMGHQEANMKLGGQFALLKVQATQVGEYCAREAIQIFGGNGVQRGGQGGMIERAWRDCKVNTIGGGSEEILTDLGVKIAMKMSNL